MNFAELVKSRYSVRKYTDKKVSQDDLTYILECARFAPSACNRQPWSVYVVQSDEVLTKVKSAYRREWISNVSTILVLSAHHDVSWHRDKTDNKDHADVDMAILADHIILAAQEKGISTCWVCAFDPDICKKAIGISDASEEPVVMIPMGYSESESQTTEKKRKTLEEIVVYK